MGFVSLSWAEKAAVFAATAASAVASVTFNIGVLAAVRSNKNLRVRTTENPERGQYQPPKERCMVVADMGVVRRREGGGLNLFFPRQGRANICCGLKGVCMPLIPTLLPAPMSG